MSPNISLQRKFVSPEIVFGAGCRHSVGTCASNFGARKVLVVSDPGVVAAGWVADVQASLERQGIEHHLFTEVSPNPRCEEVMLGAEAYRNQGCNVIVAVGGGSPMDCAKGIGIVVAHGRHIVEFEGVDTLRIPSPPLILIPTTAGTSADVSQFVIISNQDERMKFSIVSKAAVPDVSLIDPETTLSMDPFLSACTGIDALVHAIEAFVSTGHGPLTDPHALEAMRLINGNLVQMISNPPTWHCASRSCSAACRRAWRSPTPFSAQCTPCRTASAVIWICPMACVTRCWSSMWSRSTTTPRRTASRWSRRRWASTPAA